MQFIACFIVMIVMLLELRLSVVFSNVFFYVHYVQKVGGGEGGREGSREFLGVRPKAGSPKTCPKGAKEGGKVTARSAVGLKRDL